VLYLMQVIVSGKLRAQRAKAMKFKDGYMISSGSPVNVSHTPPRLVILADDVSLLCLFESVVISINSHRPCCGLTVSWNSMLGLLACLVKECAPLTWVPSVVGQIRCFPLPEDESVMMPEQTAWAFAEWCSRSEERWRNDFAISARLFDQI
jgi:hypothetical protein